MCRDSRAESRSPSRGRRLNRRGRVRLDLWLKDQDHRVVRHATLEPTHIARHGSTDLFPDCQSLLRSNLRTVSLIEWLVGAGPIFLIAPALLKTEVLADRVELVTLLLFAPACVDHEAVLCRYLKLSATPRAPG